MPPSKLNSNTNSDEILPIKEVREIHIPSLIKDLSEAKRYLSEKLPDKEQAENIATQIEKLRKDLIFINHVFTGLNTFEKMTSDLFKVLLHEFPATQTRFHDLRGEQFQPKIKLLGDIIIKLKLLLPSLNKSSSLPSKSGENKLLNKLSDLHSSKVFYESPAFKDFQDVYNSLGVTAKLCLLCFAVFPENEVLKKKRLVHWCIGEGILYPPADGENTVEEIADGIFEELTKKGCIEPVKKKRRSDVHSFKMHPLIHFAVIRIAKDVGFLDFDDKFNPTTEFSRSYRACLMSGCRLKLENKPNLDPEKLHTIFNVNESYPNFSGVEWSKLKNVEVLYLGRWHSRAKHHIEVADIDFLKWLTHLRFLSLRGVSGIMKLPASLCKLVCLRILDLGACHNLEVLPHRIDSLKNLTHLDMSECYLLDFMPKGIALLSELEVLKGFIINNKKNSTSCFLHDLSRLQKLRKLTINTSREDFPKEEELTALQGFCSLQKLTIAWGEVTLLANKQGKRIEQNNAGAQPKAASTMDSAASEKAKTGIKNHVPKIPAKSLTLKRAATWTESSQQDFKKLEKLDLQCYPQMTAPSWLVPGMLTRLKKLYIRGGQLRSLGQVHDKKWTVETLRLKYLSELKIDWNELQVSFPKLTYLEKFKCPKATFFPCNETGVWLKPGN